MKFETKHIIAITIGIVIIIFDIIFFFRTQWFVPLIVTAVTISWIQYWVDFFVTLQKQKELEEKFPEFVRNLVGAIKSGMPAPKAIMHVSTTDYGALTSHVKKLANQVEWAIPVHKALLNFANETKNLVIKRAIDTVIEAEISGGNIEDVLESVTNSVIEIKKIKQKRRAGVHGQIIQGYVIFLVFLGVIVIIQNLLVPYVADMQQTPIAGLEAEEMTLVETGLTGMIQKVTIDLSSFRGFVSSLGRWFVSMRGVFLMIVVIQGLFAGLVLGKLSEGEVLSGLKHSLILITFAFFVITFAQGAL